MLVKTLKAHTNGFGEKFAKAEGDIYDHPNPDVLIERGKVEPTDVTVPKTRRRRGRRT